MRHGHVNGGDPAVLGAESGGDVEEIPQHVAGRPDGGGCSRRLMLGADHLHAHRNNIVAPAVLAGFGVGRGEAGAHSALRRRIHARGGLGEGLKAGGEYRCHSYNLGPLRFGMHALSRQRVTRW